MTRNKLFFKLTVVSFLFMFCLLPLNQARGEIIELKFSHFVPVQHLMHKNIVEPWIQKIEKAANGKVKITVFPAQQLGKAPEQYDLVLKGAADIAIGMPDYTPGRFPLTAGITLPFLVKNGETGSIVLWNLYLKFLKDEYKDVKVLWFHCHGPGDLHAVKKPIKTLDDLKGLKIRTPNPVMAKVFEKLGATTVTIPVTEAYAALQSGKADSILNPWEGLKPFKFYELTKYSTIANVYTMPFFVIMNKQKYESLPPDVKKVFDENSGEAMAAMSGKAFDAEDAAVRTFAQQNGGQVYILPAEEREKWKKASMFVGDEWIKQMEAKGLPGKAFLEKAMEMLLQIQ